MSELRDAIDDADWPRALGLALDAWRETRAPALADLVDRIAARIDVEPAPLTRIQPWWMQRARMYDPVTAKALLASADAGAHKSEVTWDVIAASHPASPVVQRLLAEIEDRYVDGALFTGMPHRNRLERLAAMLAWPDDPRLARVLAEWFAASKVEWRFPYTRAALAYYELLAEKVVDLRDTRVIPILERAIAEPRAVLVPIVERQRTLGTRAIDVLARHAPAAVDEEVSTLCPAARVEAPLDERALWTAARDDAGERLVLADYLLSRNDPRGEVITLACSGSEDNLKRSFTLLHRYWEPWLGELALVLDRGGCTFANGLLDVATIGAFATPEWAYAKVAQHRELASVRIVRPGWNASEHGYLAFLDALPALPARVRVTATMIEPMARLRPVWPIRELELVANLPELHIPFEEVVHIASRALPDLERLELPLPSELDESMPPVIAALQSRFFRLERVRIDASRLLPDPVRRAFAALAHLPFVEIDHGAFAP